MLPAEMEKTSFCIHTYFSIHFTDSEYYSCKCMLCVIEYISTLYFNLLSGSVKIKIRHLHLSTFFINDLLIFHLICRHDDIIYQVTSMIQTYYHCFQIDVTDVAMPTPR